MNRAPMLLMIVASLFGTGCSDLQRSRNLGDPRVSATTLAQQVCSNCHGIDGRATNPNFPNLAAQQPGYLISQMKQFRSHSRSDPAGFEYMWGPSRSLTDEQIQGLADYYAVQASRAPPGHSDAGMNARGLDIFEKGVADKNIPSCSVCHGPQARGNEQFPRLANQHADYLIKQLMVFQRTDERPEGSVMKTIAHDLTPGNMRDVATYLEQLPAP